MNVRDEIRSLKKAELHVHLEGCVSYPLLQNLAARHGMSLSAPVLLPGAGRSIPPPRGIANGKIELNDFTDFVAIYVKISSMIRSCEDILMISESMLESAEEQNITAIQSYFSPTTFLLLGIPLEPLFEGLIESEKLARSEFGISLSWIFDTVRNTSENGLEIVDLALEARRLGVRVVAIGLSGYEPARTAAHYVAAFERARAEGLETLAHAGETAGPESIEETLRLLRPNRIGHGIRAVEDERVLNLLIESQIPVEVSPWSNISLKVANAEDHPLPRLIDAGVNVILCADDPGIFQRDLTDNYLFGFHRGVSFELLKQCAARSVAIAEGEPSQELPRSSSGDLNYQERKHLSPRNDGGDPNETASIDTLLRERRNENLCERERPNCRWLFFGCSQKRV